MSELNLPAGFQIITTPWEKFADSLDEIRKGEENSFNKNGESKSRKIPDHLRQENVFQFVLTALAEKAQMFVDGYPYIFIPEERRIYKLHNGRDAAALWEKFRLRIVQKDYKLVDENVNHHVQCYGTGTRIEKLGTYRGDAIYVNSGRGTMFKINEKTIDEVPNGTDDVLVSNPDLMALPQMDERIVLISKSLNGIGGKITPDSALCHHLNAFFEEGGGLTEAQYQQLVILRWLSLFIGEASKMRPLMLATGEQNSGKSTLWEKFMWLLYGTDYESGALPKNMRDFVANITTNAIKVFDNIDSVNFEAKGSDFPQFIDLMCKCATGGKISIAELYKTNVEREYVLRCDLFMTARSNPFPSHRSDLLRRMITFPIRTPDKYVTVERMKRDLMRDRDQIMLETLVRLRNIGRAMNRNAAKEYDPMSQMHSFEEWTMRIADHEGWADEMKAIWRGYMGDVQVAASENSQFVDFIKCWIGMTSRQNVGREVRSSEIYRDLQEAFSYQFTALFKSPARFGRALGENISALKILGAKRRILAGYKLYTFDTTSEQVLHCRALYADLASRRLTGDDAILLPDLTEAVK